MLKIPTDQSVSNQCIAHADDYGALEPHISGKIMELHHKKHHQTYVSGLNSALETIAEAESKGDFTKAASVAPLLNFHGGGHLNHSLFWENLAPASRDGGGEPSGNLKVNGSFPTHTENTALTSLPTSRQPSARTLGHSTSSASR